MQYLITKRDDCAACRGIGINALWITPDVLNAVATNAELIPISAPPDARQLTCPECYGLRYTDTQVDLLDVLASLPDLP